MCLIYVYFAAFFAVISFIDPKSLYCTGPDWITSLNQSTPFCAISGNILYESIHFLMPHIYIFQGQYSFIV